MTPAAGIRCRFYGDSGPIVIVVHGGPGAAGSMAPVARRLAQDFRVLEPWQRGSGGPRLTVARHVADLHDLIVEHCAGERPALVGSSWGAMLVLAYAAEHPEHAGPLVLVGCGTFDVGARARFEETIRLRCNPEVRRRLLGLETHFPDSDAQLRALGELLLPVYSHDLVSTDTEIAECDARAMRETWDDMVGQQQRGLYPQSFTAIASPVLMLHGAVDPHPGPMIRAGLEPYIPQLEYHEWPECGHYPWLERSARGLFFETLSSWLFRTMT